MTIGDAILLGVIQGLTEFLPISSTAHLLAARQLLGHEHPEDAFTVVVQLGTLAAVLWYFRKEVARLIAAVVVDFRSRRFASSPESRMAWLIVLGTIPVVVVGGTLKKWLETNFYNMSAMAIVTIVFALLMAASEFWARARRNVANPGKSEADVGWKEALWIGVWQALALMPGASRSGATITGGLFAGLTRPAAARFSFLLSLPSVFAAGVKSVYDEAGKPNGLFASGDDVAALAVGTLVSAVVGYGSIAVLLYLLKHFSTAVFIAYRLIVGVTVLLLISFGYWPVR